MAARIQQALSKAKAAVQPAYATARKEVVKRYDALMAENAQYVVKDAEKANVLLKQYTYTNIAKIPEKIAVMEGEAAAARKRLGEWREMPVTEAAIYVGFAAEVYAWFCVGEIVGRGFSLSGYSF